MRSISTRNTSVVLALLLVLIVSGVVMAGSWGNSRYGLLNRNTIAALHGILAVILIPYGIINCYFGYKMFKFILMMIGFITGAFIGALLATSSGADEAVAGLVALVCGIAGAYISLALYFVGVFLVGAGAGAALVYVLSQGNADTGAVVVFAIIAGVVALFVQKAMIIIATSFTGAYSLVFFIVLRASRIEPGAILALMLLFFVTGMLVQFKTTAKGLPDSVKEQLGKDESEVSTAIAEGQGPIDEQCIVNESIDEEQPG